MASVQSQDAVFCQLCPNPVEHHCNLCHVDLCSSCISIHMADRTKRHEVVEFINRREGHILPECTSHDKNRCEMFCKDCNEPMCVLCVTSNHRRHDITDIKEIIDEFKQRIIADMAELETTIAPKYRNRATCVPSAEFDEVISAIQDQEDEICHVVRDIGSEMRDEVKKQKQKSEQKNTEIQSSAVETEKEVDKIIKNCKRVINSRNATSIIGYDSRNAEFRDGFKETKYPCPQYLCGVIKKDQILDMFGGLQIQKNNASDEQSCTLTTVETPVVLNIMKSPYGGNSLLWRITCDGDKIWVSGNNGTIFQLDRNGSVLKTINLTENVIGLSLNVQQELVFIKGWADTKVWKHKNNSEVAILELSNWRPRGLCHTVDGNLLISMRSLDRTRSRVVRYSGTTETQVIENDSQGNPLFSVHTQTVLHLTENGNEDVCVADCAGNAVVVFGSSGDFQFMYKGNVSIQLKQNSFKPLHIANDTKLQIFVGDFSNDLIHITDCKGNFVRFIDFSCKGGICVNADCNLIAGDDRTGEIRIIKYNK